MPAPIRKITQRYLRNPAEITIKVKTTTAETIRQRYWPVTGTHKLDALTRILEAESFDAMLVFVRTKTATLEVAEKLEARGYRASALNGDIAQKNRERIITQLKRAASTSTGSVTSSTMIFRTIPKPMCIASGAPGGRVARATRSCLSHRVKIGCYRQSKGPLARKSS
jgi:hypothetical protein